jgi:tRNA pseudouridine38-40 synthase
VNSELPGDVRAWASADVDDTFHATHDAERREYTYYLYAPALDDGRAAAALAALCGDHDFHNLTPDSRGTRRDLGGSLVRDGPFLVLTLAAGGFARQLVRRVVSLVRAVGRGEPLATVERVLAPTPVRGEDGIPSAPAEPLVLTDVTYPGVGFTVDGTAATAARRLFDDRAVDGLVRARVAGRIRDGIGAAVDGGPDGNDDGRPDCDGATDP